MTRIATLGEFLAPKTKGIVPATTPEQEFELYSVPSFEGRRPEIVFGSAIGSNKQIVEPGTVLLCKINPRINRAWYVSSFSKHKKIASTEWITFPPCKEIEPRYLTYFLRQSTIREYLSANASGVGGSLMRVKGATIQNLAVPVPSRDAQKEIVAELEKQFSRLDEAVANLQRVKANLKRYKASVLKAAVEGRLVETEATLARREGRTYETGEQLLQRIEDGQRNAWKGRGGFKSPIALPAAKLPNLPIGWIWATADQVCSQITDGEHIQPRYQNFGFPMLTAKNVRDGYVEFDNAGLIAEGDFQNCMKRCAPVEGDILIVSVGATTGRAAVVGPAKPFALVRSVLLLKPVIPSRYLLSVIQSSACQTYIQRASGSTAQAHLYIKDTRSLPIPIPPLAEQVRIVAEVDRHLSIIREVEAEVDTNLQRAQALRQSVLQKSFHPRSS